MVVCLAGVLSLGGASAAINTDPSTAQTGPGLAASRAPLRSGGATIEVEDARRFISDETFPWMDYDFNVAFQNRLVRMGLATLDKQTYFAVRDKLGGIRVAPELGGPNPAPSLDNAKTIVIPATDSPLLVAGFMPLDGFLVLVYFGQNGNHFYVQRFKSTGNPNLPLVKSGDPLVVKTPGVQNVLPVIGDRGLYVHTISRNSGILELDSYFIDGVDHADFLSPASYDVGYVPAQRYLADAVSTHEVPPSGENPIEVHYIAWIGGQGIVVARFTPSLVAPSVNPYVIAAPVPDPLYDNQQGTILSLVETNLQGAANPDYGVSLIRVSKRTNGGAMYAQARAISTSTHLMDSQWTPISFPIEGVTANSFTHVGIDKSLVRAKGEPRTPGNYLDSIRLCTGMAILSLNDSPSWVVRSGTILGNRLETPAGPGNGIKVLDTFDALKAATPADRDAQLAAWSLIGVIHGVPPFASFNRKNPAAYPTTSFNTSYTVATSSQLLITSEDSEEFTIGATLGGLPKEGFGTGAEFSYGYGVKTATSSSTSTSLTLNTSETYTTVASGFSNKCDPSNVGSLLFSAPQFVSKTYNVLRPDGSDFTDGHHQLFLTKVTKRTPKFLHYLLAAPEKGPLETLPAVSTQENPLGALTRGIRPVSRTDDFKSWKMGPEPGVDYTNAYDEFGATTGGAGSAIIDESYGSSSNLTFNYSTSDGRGGSQSLVKTHKESVKFTAGIIGFFVGTFSGAASQSTGYSSSFSSSVTMSQAISVAVPPLPQKQPVQSMSVVPMLVFPKGGKNDRPPVWVPTLLSDSQPFLLTWRIDSIFPPELGRQPFKQPNYNYPYPN